MPIGVDPMETTSATSAAAIPMAELLAVSYLADSKGLDLRGCCGIDGHGV